MAEASRATGPIMYRLYCYVTISGRRMLTGIKTAPSFDQARNIAEMQLQGVQGGAIRICEQVTGAEWQALSAGDSISLLQVYGKEPGFNSSNYVV